MPRLCASLRPIFRLRYTDCSTVTLHSSVYRRESGPCTILKLSTYAMHIDVEHKISLLSIAMPNGSERILCGVRGSCTMSIVRDTCKLLRCHLMICDVIGETTVNGQGANVHDTNLKIPVRLQS